MGSNRDDKKLEETLLTYYNKEEKISIPGKAFISADIINLGS